MASDILNLHNPQISEIPPLLPLEAIVTAISDFVYTFDLDGRFTYSNPALLNLLGISLQDISGKNFFDLNYPADLATRLQNQIQQVIDTKGSVRAETPFESASGLGHYEYIFWPILSHRGDVTAVAGTTRDITLATTLTSEIKAEREKLKNLFEQAPAFICTLRGPTFIFEFANEEYYKLIGHRNILGKTVLEVFPEVATQGYVELLERVFATGETFTGRGIPLSIDLGNGQKSDNYIDFIYQAIRDPAGAVTGILVHGNDVTDQVLARRELDLLNQQLESRVLERTQQLEFANRELEGFTYSIAHDLRAPLRAIISSSQILMRDYASQLDGAAITELDRQSRSAKRLAVLIDELLKVSRLSRQDLHRSALDLTALARTVAARIVENNDCPFEVQEGLKVFADETTVQLLLENLIGNAFKFSPNGGRVSMGQINVDGESAFYVKDEGIGFDMQYVHKIFLPFERLVTDSEYDGTGIGLSNVKRIAERHGGKVWCESALGEGATFFFTLSS